jgi:hypothetical protein
MKKLKSLVVSLALALLLASVICSVKLGFASVTYWRARRTRPALSRISGEGRARALIATAFLVSPHQLLYSNIAIL